MEAERVGFCVRERERDNKMRNRVGTNRLHLGVHKGMELS